jgi:hypothetical protein
MPPVILLQFNHTLDSLLFVALDLTEYSTATILKEVGHRPNRRQKKRLAEGRYRGMYALILICIRPKSEGFLTWERLWPRRIQSNVTS